MGKANIASLFIKYPLSTLRMVFYKVINKSYDLRKMNDDIHLRSHGKKINWESPIDLNEKINWLMLNTDTSEWTTLADKYLVRDFISERIGDKYLVPLLGVWEKADDIDYSKLPNSFVLKTNNGAGSVIIVKDKAKINIKEVTEKLDQWMKYQFGEIHAQPHYSKIKPLIIAESLLMEEGSKISNSLIDYKIWCFDGKVFGSWCCFNRHGFSADTEWHDLDWNYHPEWSVFTDHYRCGGGKLPKPKNYDEMLNVASKLSLGFPQVRVDLYNIDGQIYFGEMTFTAAGGHIDFYSSQILEEMGELTHLGNKNLKHI